MTLVHQQIGNAVAQWDSDSPIKWSMEETVGKRDNRRTNRYEFDLTSLEQGYEGPFLEALRDALTARRHQIALVTISTEAGNIRSLLKTCQEAGIMSAKVVQIDHAFLIGLSTLADRLAATCLSSLRRLYDANRSNTSLFCPLLRSEDFPLRTPKRGNRGDFIDRILSKALTRSAMVAVLDVLETAFETGEINLGRYAFGKLALNIFCRPESYRQITLADLRLDRNPETRETDFFLDVAPAKAGLSNPRKITYRVHRDVGQLLALQRESVVERYGHLCPDELGRLALFPAVKLRTDGTWVAEWARANHGMFKTADSFSRSYLQPISDLAHKNLNFVALRHTIGTQLAQAGCSADTIAAVLKHATNRTCQFYVDICFDGLIDQLSDALEPGFQEHFPVFELFASKQAELPRERTVVSTDPETGRSETTALCGRRSICQYAPLACYQCPRFIPCWDADHRINLNMVEREIEAYEGHGLAMQHEAKKYKHLRNCICVVITACELKRRAMELEAAR